MNTECKRDDEQEYSAVYTITCVVSTRAKTAIEARLKFDDMLVGLVKEDSDGERIGQVSKIEEFLAAQGLNSSLLSMQGGPMLIGLDEATANDRVLKRHWNDDSRPDCVEASRRVREDDPEREAKEQREIERMTAEQVEGLRLIAVGKRPSILIAEQLMAGCYIDDDNYTCTLLDKGQRALNWWNKREEKPTLRVVEAPSDDEDGMPASLAQAIDAGRRQFEKKFGRPPREGDPFLFDADSDIPVPMPEQKLQDQMVVTMVDAGIPPRLIWIYFKTGLIPTEDNQHLMSRQDRRAWKRASRKYEHHKAELTAEIAAARERVACNQYRARD